MLGLFNSEGAETGQKTDDRDIEQGGKSRQIDAKLDRHTKQKGGEEASGEKGSNVDRKTDR